MAKRAKEKNAKNHWRQMQYLRDGTVMLPPLSLERKIVKQLSKEVDK